MIIQSISPDGSAGRAGELPFLNDVNNFATLFEYKRSCIYAMKDVL